MKDMLTAACGGKLNLQILIEGKREGGRKEAKRFSMGGDGKRVLRLFSEAFPRHEEDSFCPAVTGIIF